MMFYSLQPRSPIFVKGYGYFSFAQNMGKNIGQISKKISVNIVRNLLIMPNNLLQKHLKLLQKE